MQNVWQKLSVALFLLVLLLVPFFYVLLASPAGGR